MTVLSIIELNALHPPFFYYYWLLGRELHFRSDGIHSKLQCEPRWLYRCCRSVYNIAFAYTSMRAHTLTYTDTRCISHERLIIFTMRTIILSHCECRVRSTREWRRENSNGSRVNKQIKHIDIKLLYGWLGGCYENACTREIKRGEIGREIKWLKCQTICRSMRVYKRKEPV